MSEKMVDRCLNCECLKRCYNESFIICHRIKIAVKGMGMPYKAHKEDDLYLNNIPFSVHQSLKTLVHDINNNEKKFIGRW